MKESESRQIQVSPVVHAVLLPTMAPKSDRCCYLNIPHCTVPVRVIKEDNKIPSNVFSFSNYRRQSY